MGALAISITSILPSALPSLDHSLLGVITTTGLPSRSTGRVSAIASVVLPVPCCPVIEQCRFRDEYEKPISLPQSSTPQTSSFPNATPSFSVPEGSGGRPTTILSSAHSLERAMNFEAYRPDIISPSGFSCGMHLSIPLPLSNSSSMWRSLGSRWLRRCPESLPQPAMLTRKTESFRFLALLHIETISAAICVSSVPSQTSRLADAEKLFAPKAMSGWWEPRSVLLACSLDSLFS